MVKIITPGRPEFIKVNINQFVECVVRTFKLSLNEEHITSKDKLKQYRDYIDGAEVKKELGNLLNDFVNKYKRNDYIRKVDFYVSKKEGLSNYIEITFNAPFGVKEWLKHMKIRISDHPKHNDRKIDEYIKLEGKSVEDIENELDIINNRRIRRLQREEQGVS